MIMGLRMLDGIENERFFRQFDKRPEDVFAKPLERAIDQGLLEQHLTVIVLPAKD